MIPTRTEIQKKINEIKEDPNFSTIKEDLYQRLSEWLDSLNMPATITLFGEEKNPKQMILDDLSSYEGY